MESNVFKDKKETGSSKFITIKKDPSKKPVMILSSIVNEFSLSAQQQQSPPKSQIKKEENKEKEEENKIEKKEEKKEEKEEENKIEKKEEKKEEIKIIKKPILSFSNQIQDSISIAPITQNKIIIDSEDKKKEEIKIIKKPLLSLSSQPQDSISIEPIIQNQIKIDLEDKKKEKKKSPEVKSLSPIITNPKKKIEIKECPQISFDTKATSNIINIKKKKKPITNDDILKEIEKINQEEEKIKLRKASKRKEKDKRKKKNKNERPQSVNYDRRNQNIININTHQFNIGSKKQELSFIPQAEFALGNINNLKLKKTLEKQKDFSINKAADFICEGDPILIQNRNNKKKGKKEEVKVNYPPFDIDQFLEEYYKIK